MSTEEGSRGPQANRHAIKGPWRYFVAAAPMVGFLTLVALVFYLLG